MGGTRPEARSASEAAKRTGRVYDEPWTTADLREFVSWRSLNICEWPGCLEPGEHLAHVFGKGSGGRRSANRPENVAWLCVHHHDVLDGRIRLRFEDAARLVMSMPLRVDGDELPLCSWYCGSPALGRTFAGRPLCDFHERLADENCELHSAPLSATRRRFELGQAMAMVVEAENRKMGLAE
jgi:hypothetical protein